MPEFGTLYVPGSHGAHQGRVQPEVSAKPVPKSKGAEGSVK